MARWVQECRVLAPSERPGLLETHFFSSSELPSTRSFLSSPERAAQGLWLRSLRPGTQFYLSDRPGTAVMEARVLTQRRDPTSRPSSAA